MQKHALPILRDAEYNLERLHSAPQDEERLNLEEENPHPEEARKRRREGPAPHDDPTFMFVDPF